MGRERKERGVEGREREGEREIGAKMKWGRRRLIV